MFDMVESLARFLLDSELGVGDVSSKSGDGFAPHSFCWSRCLRSSSLIIHNFPDNISCFIGRIEGSFVPAILGGQTDAG
eukprot:1349085-Amorphochlora_amoeboformis.AAC.2